MEVASCLCNNFTGCQCQRNPQSEQNNNDTCRSVLVPEKKGWAVISVVTLIGLLLGVQVLHKRMGLDIGGNKSDGSLKGTAVAGYSVLNALLFGVGSYVVERVVSNVWTFMKNRYTLFSTAPREPNRPNPNDLSPNAGSQSDYIPLSSN